jgi:hypothetical protein
MWCAIYLACLMVVGWGVVVRFGRERSRLESLGLSAVMGPGIAGMVLIGLSLLGMKPGRASIFILTGAAAISGMTARRSAQSPAATVEDGDRAPAWWVGICLIVMAYSAHAVAMEAFVYTTYDWDGYGIWQLKAKVLTHEALSPRPVYFTEVSRSYSHLRYPILVPMISAGEKVMSGRLDDEKAKSPFFLMYLGVSAAVYGAIRVRRGSMAAITATALLMSAPEILATAGRGTADLPLGAFWGCSLICLLNWQRDRRCADLAMFGLFTIFICWTKQEGVPLAILNVLAVVALAPKRPKIWLTLTLAVGLAYLPWLLFIRGLPKTDENYLGHLHANEFVENIWRVGPAILGFLKRAFDWRNWDVFWYALVAIALLEWRRFKAPGVALLWILLAAHFLIYLPPYVIVANWDFHELMRITQDRLMVHIAPAAALLIGLQWPMLRRAITLREPGIHRPQPAYGPQ